MQVSTPIHVPVMSDRASLEEQEPIQSKSVQGKSLKNDKLGVFAKILEGLTRNPKPGLGVAGEFPGEIPGEALESGEGNPRAEKAPKGNVRGRKKGPGFPGEEKPLEALGSSNRKSRGDKAGFPEAMALLVPPGVQTNSTEPVQKEGILGGRIHSKYKKDGNSPPQALSGKKTMTSGKEELLSDGALKTRTKSEEPPSTPLKTDTAIPRLSKGEKEGSRKGMSLSSRMDQRKEGQIAQSALTSPGTLGRVEKEGKGGGKVAESRGKDKRRERIGLEVRDLRSWEAAPQEPAQGTRLGVEVRPSGETKPVELLVELSSGNKNREEVFRGAVNTPGQAFEDMLARELYQNLNNDIVRQAQVILRDSGEGTIRLALKPESLGNVKIQLEMAENKITGHIIVESNEALRAFEREIRSLEQAFKDSGFAGASLDTALASGGEGNGRDQQWRGGNSFFSERFVSSSYDAVADRVEDPVGLDRRSGLGLPLVNMLA